MANKALSIVRAYARNLNAKPAAVTALVLASVASAHAAEQPDLTELLAYMTAGVATIGLVGNATLLGRGALRVFAWVRSAIR